MRVHYCKTLFFARTKRRDESCRSRDNSDSASSSMGVMKSSCHSPVKSLRSPVSISFKILGLSGSKEVIMARKYKATKMDKTKTTKNDIKETTIIQTGAQNKQMVKLQSIPKRMQTTTKESRVGVCKHQHYRRARE